MEEVEGDLAVLTFFRGGGPMLDGGGEVRSITGAVVVVIATLCLLAAAAAVVVVLTAIFVSVAVTSLLPFPPFSLAVVVTMLAMAESSKSEYGSWVEVPALSGGKKGAAEEEEVAVIIVWFLLLAPLP